jgi:hypothetical protein
MGGRSPPVGPLQLQLLEPLAALLVWEPHQVASVEVEQVEDREHDRDLLGAPLDAGVAGEVHAVLEALEAGAPVLVERDDLAVEDRVARAELAVQRPQLGIALGHVREAAALDAQPAGLGVHERAHAVPLDLERPPLLVAREGARRGEHRHEALRHGLPPGVGGRVHPVDHPVLLVLARAEEDVLAGEPLAVEGDDHLVVAELLALVGAGVPDLHRARAVLALRDVPLEVDVLERVVLGVDRLAVLLRVLRDPVRDRPAREHAVALEPQVPVEAAGVVLLDDEARQLRLRLALAPSRLLRLLEVALLLVVGEPVRHLTRRYPRGSRDSRGWTAATPPARPDRCMSATCARHCSRGCSRARRGRASSCGWRTSTASA